MRLSVVGQKHPGAAWSALSKQLTLPGQRRLAGLGVYFEKLVMTPLVRKTELRPVFITEQCLKERPSAPIISPPLYP